MINNNEEKKVTIYSVAHEAGVSLATVSRVINDSGLVKEDTKQRVEQAIIKLGYRPNAVAQGLALKKTTTIALVVPDSGFLYMGDLLSGLLDVARTYHYNVTLHKPTEGITEMKEIVENITKSRADGVIIYNDSLSQSEVDTLNSYSIPVVYVGHQSKLENAHSVYVDYSEAVKTLVSKYLDKGIDDIILVEDRKNPVVMEQLKSGISEAFAQKGKVFTGYLNIKKEYHNSFDYLSDYFSKKKHKLVITYRDSQAISVLNACKENNIDIPNDTELVCMLGTRYNQMARPRISSFVIPSYDIGALAMRIMTKMLNHNEPNEKNHVLSYVYNPKESTK